MIGYGFEAFVVDVFGVIFGLDLLDSAAIQHTRPRWQAFAVHLGATNWCITCRKNCLASYMTHEPYINVFAIAYYLFVLHVQCVTKEMRARQFKVAKLYKFVNHCYKKIHHLSLDDYSSCRIPDIEQMLFVLLLSGSSTRVAGPR